MFDNLSPLEVKELLSRQIIGRLGCYADGRIYITPLSYAFDEQYIYIHSYYGKKIDMMRTNPQVCFQVDDMRDLANWQSVIAWGDYEELTDPIDRVKALNLLMSRNFPFVTSVTMQLTDQWPFGGDSTIDGVFFRIKINEASGRCEKTTERSYFAS